MNVPLLDLKSQYRGIKSEILAVIESVCDEQGFVLGPRLAEFEKATAHYIGSRHAVGCASGSDALLLALMASGVKAGDEVITVPFTFFATAGAISRLGAKPVFVDIESDSFNIDPHQIERAVCKREGLGAALRQRLPHGRLARPLQHGARGIDPGHVAARRLAQRGRVIARAATDVEDACLSIATGGHDLLHHFGMNCAVAREFRGAQIVIERGGR